MTDVEITRLIEELLSEETHDINSLRKLMKVLRSPRGCPWDMEQNHKSIRNSMIEEAYEAVEAIDIDSSELLKEELGDVLLQVIFHSEIEDEEGRFNFDDVTHDICSKLIYRHPHVFDTVKADTSEEVLNNWEKLKKIEKSDTRPTVTADMRDLPKSLPSLIRGQKVGKKAAKVGFDFDNAAEALEKVSEEVIEIKSALENHESSQRIKEEIGDLLLAVTSVARLSGIDSEEALTFAVNKFIDRFEGVEKNLINENKTFAECDKITLNRVWEAQK